MGLPFGGTWVEAVILVGVALLGAIYVYQVVFSPMIGRFLNAKNLENAQERQFMLMNKFYEEQNELYGLKRDISDAAPFIKLLRTVEHENSVTCIFANKGGLARDLAIEPFGAFTATLTPQDHLNHNDTGRVTLSHIATSSNAPLEFELSYKNKYGEAICRRYQYDALGQKFKEL